MDLDSKRLVVVVPNEAPTPPCGGLSREDEAWRSYLENPLTAATKAMMSINGDEDSAAALGLLYDFYEVSKHKRSVSGSAAVPGSDQNLHVLGSEPINLTRNNAEPPGRQNILEEFRGGERKGGGGLAPVVVKREDDTSVFPCFGRSYPEDQRERSPTVSRQSCGDLSLAAYLKEEEQRNSPDSTCDDDVQGEMYQRSASSRGDDPQSRPPAFQYCLDASASLRPRQEGSMAYLNRGQFYPLTLSGAGFRSFPRFSKGGSGERSAVGGSVRQRDSMVQSVIMVVFGEEKCRDEQLKNWKYWHSRQHTAKQRVLDMADYKESFSTVGNVEEIAYNAVSFTWDISEEAKVFISVNCLSTDFTSQKGVKGTPLVLQVDTYRYSSCSSRPVHRAVAHIKVFCDKGAERKLRDEEKKQLRRKKGKNVHSEPNCPSKKVDGDLFKAVTDLDSQPVLFIPDVHFGTLQRAGQVFAFNTEEVDRDRGVLMKKVPRVAGDAGPPRAKRAKVEPDQRVLLYVRKECDEAFDALMLRSPTLEALMEAIAEKYSVPVDKKAKVYQKSKKGILVNMDDNIIQHFSNEDTFILAMEGAADSLRVTLSELAT